MSDSSRREVSGYVIGICHDTGHFLMYSSNFNNLLRIDENVDLVSPGRWLSLIEKYEGLDWHQVLNTDNCDGFDNFDNTVPPRVFIHARYFPLKCNFAFGEVVFSVKVEVVDDRKHGLRFECYEVDPIHILKNEKITTYRFQPGKTYIFELQASLVGWILLRVHDDQLYCDELVNPCVPYNVSFLDQTTLSSILTKYQSKYREELPVQRKEVIRKPASLDSSPLASSSSSCSSSSSPGCSTKDIRESVRRTKISVEQAGPSNIANFGDLDDCDLKCIEGTTGLTKREENYGKERRRWLQEAGLDNLEDIKAIGVIVYKTENYAVVFVKEPETTKQPMINNALLIFDQCRGLEQLPKVGDFGLFRISKRRKRSDDWSLSHIPFSHVVTEQFATKSASRAAQDIVAFRNMITSFGGIMEIRVAADLSKIHTVTPYFDPAEIKSIAGRHFYIIKTVDGWRVTIPCKRLREFLSSSFTAPFVIETWATLKKPIGNYCLQIGLKTEVICTTKKEGGKKFTLPILSDGIISEE